MHEELQRIVWTRTSEDGQVDGFVPEVLAAVSLEDRGLRYGDGVFETMAVVKGRIPWLERHLSRLRTSLDLLGFAPLPLTDAELRSGCAETVRRNALDEGTLRLTVTRVGGGRGYSTSGAAGWRLVALTAEERPLLDGTMRGLACVTVPWCIDPAYPGQMVKSLSGLDKVFAARHATSFGADQALVWNVQGRLVEASSSNVFVVHGDTVRTPSIESGPLAGIARGVVLELLRDSPFAVLEGNVERQHVANATEMFLTNAVHGIMPVRSVDGRQLPQHAPGPVTEHVFDAYCRALDEAVDVSLRPEDPDRR